MGIFAWFFAKKKGNREEPSSAPAGQKADRVCIEPTANEEASGPPDLTPILQTAEEKKVFLPECFLCEKPMEEVEDWGVGLQGGDIICDYCKEKYHYRISRGEMTLRRAVVPVGFKGEIERNYFHIKNTSKKRDKIMNDNEMLSILKKLCNAYAQNDSAYKELEPLATEIGKQLHERGGINEMRRIFAQLGKVRGARTLEMHWDGIGEWRG